MVYICSHGLWYHRVSEYLVWKAGLQKLPIAIYRPGMISWSTENGKGNKVIVEIVKNEKTKMFYICMAIKIINTDECIVARDSLLIM